MRFNYPGWRIIKKYKVLFAALLVLTIVSTGLEAVSIGLIVPLLNSFLQKQNGAVSQGWIIDQFNQFFGRFEIANIFLWVFVCFFAANLLKIIFKISRESVKVILSQKIKVDCNQEMFEKNVRADVSFFVNNKVGDLSFRVLNLPLDISNYFTLLPSIVIEGINILLIGLLLLSFSKFLFLLVVIVGLVFGAVIGLMSKKVFERSGHEFNDISARQNVTVYESLTGIRDIIMFGKREQWISRFRKQCQRFFHLKIRISILRLIPGNLLELLAVGGLCAIGFFYGIKDPEAALQMLPVIALYAVAIIKVIPSFSTISQDWTHLASMAPSVVLYEKYLAEKNIHLEDGKEAAAEFRSEIDFQGVSFGYVPQRLVFDGLDLTIPKNKTIAIVGGSGAGKSTLIDLLSGLYEPEQGAILVDGKDLKNLSKRSWRGLIGVVPQHPTIFHASVKENIALEFDGINMAKVEDAARAAGAEEFIKGLAGGYDTELGDRGLKLSGGQRQRIAIARALYRNPEILIFDEATSALDNRTEQTVLEMMTRFSKRKTIIILAHRLSTIENADLIYVLKDKRVIQSGTHRELLEQKGSEYTNLYTS